MVSVKVNGGTASDFVLDTGAEQTVVSRDVARKRGVVPITYMQTAGVGDVGLRGLQVGRIDALEIGSLKVRNVPCLIKNPPLGDLPSREPESFSPLALGLSMRLDYARRLLVMGRTLPSATYATELPLSLYRLATVRGMVNGQPATFVVDTGGEVISISQATAGQMTVANTYRRIPLKVYGTSGWDKDAFLMPNVDLEFNSIRFSKIPVVVLNLRAPSALLGFQLGGIVGHKFLSRYRVSIDLVRSVVGLDAGEFVVRSTTVVRTTTLRTRASSALRACEPLGAARVGFGGLALLFLGLENQSRNRNPLLVGVDGDEGQVGDARQPPHAGQDLLREDLDLDFERRAPGGGDARLEDDQVADLDRVEELQAVDGGGDEQAARVAVTGDGAGDVDEVHDRPAEDVAQRVGVVRQDDLHHLRRGLGRPLRTSIVLAFRVDETT